MSTPGFFGDGDDIADGAEGFEHHRLGVEGGCFDAPVLELGTELLGLRVPALDGFRPTDAPGKAEGVLDGGGERQFE